MSKMGFAPRRGALSMMTGRRQNHRVVPPAPISTQEVDRTLGNTGSGLRGLVSRVAGRVARPQLAAKGGKISRLVGGRYNPSVVKRRIMEEEDRILNGGLSDRDLSKSRKTLQGLKDSLKKNSPKYSVEPEMTTAEKKNFDTVGYLNKPIKKAKGGKVKSALQALKNSVATGKSPAESSDAEFMLKRLSESTASRKVGDLVRGYKGRSNSKIASIDGDAVTLENGDRMHISKVRNAEYAKGGKVSRTIKSMVTPAEQGETSGKGDRIIRALKKRLAELEGKLAYGEIDKKTGRVKGETPEQAAAADEYKRISEDAERKYGVILTNDD